MARNNACSPPGGRPTTPTGVQKRPGKEVAEAEPEEAARIQIGDRHREEHQVEVELIGSLSDAGAVHCAETEEETGPGAGPGGAAGTGPTAADTADRVVWAPCSSGLSRKRRSLCRLRKAKFFFKRECKNRQCGRKLHGTVGDVVLRTG